MMWNFVTMYVCHQKSLIRCFRKFSRSLLQRIQGSGNAALILTITEKSADFFCMLLGYSNRVSKHLQYSSQLFNVIHKKLVPWGTDGRLPLSDLDLDLGSGHTAYRRASLIDLYLRTKFHWDRKKIFFLKVTTEVLVKFRVTWHKN